MIGTLDFNYDYGFGDFALFVMSFVGVVIRLFNVFGIKLKLVITMVVVGFGLWWWLRW